MRVTGIDTLILSLLRAKVTVGYESGKPNAACSCLESDATTETSVELTCGGGWGNILLMPRKGSQSGAADVAGWGGWGGLCMPPSS